MLIWLKLWSLQPRFTKMKEFPCNVWGGASSWTVKCEMQFWFLFVLDGYRNIWKQKNPIKSQFAKKVDDTFYLGHTNQVRRKLMSKKEETYVLQDWTVEKRSCKPQNPIHIVRHVADPISGRSRERSIHSHLEGRGIPGIRACMLHVLDSQMLPSSLSKPRML